MQESAGRLGVWLSCYRSCLVFVKPWVWSLAGQELVVVMHTCSRNTREVKMGGLGRKSPDSRQMERTSFCTLSYDRYTSTVAYTATHMYAYTIYDCTHGHIYAYTCTHCTYISTHIYAHVIITQMHTLYYTCTLYIYTHTQSVWQKLLFLWQRMEESLF